MIPVGGVMNISAVRAAPGFWLTAEHRRSSWAPTGKGRVWCGVDALRAVTRARSEVGPFDFVIPEDRTFVQF